MEDRFIENNPVKDDISDPNRPTRISQRYQDLYENQWADAYEIVDRSTGSEAKTIETLISILTVRYFIEIFYANLITKLSNIFIIVIQLYHFVNV